LDGCFDLCPGGSICEPSMHTTTAGRVYLIHELVLKGDVQELRKELAKDMGLFFFLAYLF